MSDLFGISLSEQKCELLPSRSSQKFANGPANFSGDYSKSSQLRARTSRAKKPVEVRSAEVRELYDSLDRGGRKFANLLDQRHDLENEIEILEAELALANRMQEPYKLVFEAAHYALASLHSRRQSGKVVTKQTMLEAYDKRMLAGHAWHPFRAKAKELTEALKTYREDLKAVNKEIGI